MLTPIMSPLDEDMIRKYIEGIIRKRGWILVRTKAELIPGTGCQVTLMLRPRRGGFRYQTITVRKPQCGDVLLMALKRAVENELPPADQEQPPGQWWSSF